MRNWIRKYLTIKGTKALKLLIEALRKGDTSDLTIEKNKDGSVYVQIFGHRTVRLEIIQGGTLLISFNLDFISGSINLITLMNKLNLDYFVDPNVFLILPDGKALWGKDAINYREVMYALKEKESAPISTASFIDADMKGYKH